MVGGHKGFVLWVIFSTLAAFLFIIQIILLKKITLSLCLVCLISFSSHAQFMAAKIVGKDAARFGTGYGVFAFFDIPLSNENQSFRIELMEFAFFPSKGEKFFTSTAGARGYISSKLGYKYVFSETQAGFYLLPSAGYCRAVYADEGKDATYGDGVALALEGGYTLEVGQRSNTINLGLKYEYDRGNATHIIQSVGLRLSYGFGMFRSRD